MFATKEAKSKARAPGSRSTLTPGNAQKPARGPVEDASEEKEQAAQTAKAGTDISWSFSSIPVFPSDWTDPPYGSSSRGTARAPRSLQPKLVIGSVRDPLELEADVAADRVMRMNDHAATLTHGSDAKVQRKCDTCQCAACQQEREKDEPRTLARAKSAHGSALDSAAAPDIVEDVLHSPGQALDAPAQAFFEGRFRRGFGDVRIHTDRRAAESARSVGALAYTVGRDIVFGSDQYNPDTAAGRRLLAHELAHVEQQRGARPSSREQIFRQVKPDDPDEEEKKKRAAEQSNEHQPDPGSAEGSAAPADASPAPVTTPDAHLPTEQPKQGEGAAGPAAKGEAGKTEETPGAPATTPGGHAAAEAGMAQCPDAPPVNIVVVGCAAPASAPPAVEKVELPTPDPARFGGDMDRAKFAKELAQCRAARVVKDTIEKRFRDAVTAATAKATEEAKRDTEEAVKTATKDIDPKEKAAIAKAKARANVEAKKAAAKKIKDAQDAVKRQEVAAVTAELATAFENGLADDFRKTMDSLMKNSGPGWLKAQQTARNTKRAQVTKEKNAKPKAVKGQEPAPAKTADEIAGEIEAEMQEFRCGQKQSVLQEIEKVARAWAVGRREQVDFDTREKNAYLKDFKPTYKPADKELVPLTNPNSKDVFFGVAPEMNDFFTTLRADAATPPFRAENRKDHGGGGWAGMGFSADLYLTSAPRDQRGFWRHEDAVKFLLRLDANAKAVGARWRVLYNDFRVANEVNTTTGARNVGFVGEVDKGGSLNWHGPEGLKLHFHLDLEIPKKVPPPASASPTPAAPTTP